MTWKSPLVDPPDYDPFPHIRDCVAYLRQQIQKEYDYYGPYLRELVERGEYEAERHMRKRMNDSVNLLRRELEYVCQHLPPFTTLQNGILYRHPVTPENSHVLEKLMRGQFVRKEGES